MLSAKKQILFSSNQHQDNTKGAYTGRSGMGPFLHLKRAPQIPVDLSMKLVEMLLMIGIRLTGTCESVMMSGGCLFGYRRFGDRGRIASFSPR